MSATTSRARHVGSACLLAVLFPCALRSQTPRVTHIDSVVVVASRTQPGAAGRTVDVITRETIAASPARTLAELLGARVSVDSYTRSPAQADVAIRGSTAEQVLILVDGVRMGDAQSAHYALDLGIPLAAIDRIEILRGPGTALYGPNAIGGVINIVTRQASALASATIPAHANVRAGSFGTADLSGIASTVAGRTSVTGALQMDRSDGHRPDTDYRIVQTRLGATHPLGDGSLAANASLGVRDFGASDFYSPYPSSERTGTTTAGTRWRGALGDWSVTTGAHTRLHTDRFTLVRDNPAVYENRHRSWQTGADATARTAITNDATLVVGTDAEHDQLSSARLGGRREWRGALYTEASFAPGARVQVTAGARDDHASTYGDFLSPSLALSVAATSDITVRASGARGFRAPTWTERYYTDPANTGNPSLRPERFWNGELGARYTPRTASDIALTFDAAAFVRQAHDLIDWVRPVGRTDVPWQIENVESATFRGIEASASASPAPRVRVSVGGSGIAFHDAASSGLAGKYALRPITRQVTASISVPLVGPADIALDAMHARRATESGYSTMNAHLSIPLRGVTAFIDGTNLSNATWLDASGKLSRGRALFVGLGW